MDNPTFKTVSESASDRRTMLEISPDDKFQWLSLYLITGIGNISIKNLLEEFETPDRIFQAPAAELAKIKVDLRREFPID